MEKAQAGYMEQVFPVMLSQSDPINPPAMYPRKWTGALTSLVKEVTKGKGNYQKISAGMFETGAVDRVYRGGGSTTSEYIILRGDLYVNEDGTPAQPVTTYANSPAKQTSTAIASLNRRLSLVEMQVKQLVAALIEDQQAKERPVEKSNGLDREYTTKDLL